MHGNWFRGRGAGPASRLVVALSLVGALAWNGTVAARAQDGPKVVKSRVYVKVWQTWHTWIPAAKKFQDNASAWMPSVQFAVVGPVPGGSQLSVDFTKSDGTPWWHIDCRTDEIKAGERSTVETERDTSDAGEKKYITALGQFGFKIKIKNELSGLNQVLFSGTYKVAKISKFNGTPVTKNKCDYYVDQDWTLPIGYLYSKPDNVLPPLAASLWFKGDINGVSLAGYLFYKGNQIASTKDGGSAASTEIELNTVDNDRGDPSWKLCVCEWDQISLSPPDGRVENPHVFYLSKNPGDYEIKVLRDGKLCRDAKFAVGADGNIVDNGLAAANNLNTLRLVLPVKVLGNTDGPWNPAAWQSEAFYGNPLKGFTAP